MPQTADVVDRSDDHLDLKRVHGSYLWRGGEAGSARFIPDVAESSVKFDTMTGVAQLPHTDKIVLQTMYVGNSSDCEVAICEHAIAHDFPVGVAPERNKSSFGDRLEITKIVKSASHVQ